MERIVVVPRACLFGGDWPQGFVRAGSPEADAALRVVAAHGLVVSRVAAEPDPTWKQPIPYCTLVRDEEVFCVERLPRQGESRLHGHLSLGLGGHVEPRDLASPAGPVLAALARELAEEIRLPLGFLPPPRFLGFVNDDATPVGQVHFGLAFCQQIPAGQTVQILERSKMRGAFRHLVGPDGLWQDLGRFESWSRILLEAGAVEARAELASPADPESCDKTQEEP